jgi:hypothetical protein
MHIIIHDYKMTIFILQIGIQCNINKHLNYLITDHGGVLTLNVLVEFNLYKYTVEQMPLRNSRSVVAVTGFPLMGRKWFKAL